MRVSESNIPEIAVSRWWRNVPLRDSFTTDCGRPVSIIFRGTWSHGQGPDFQEAMVNFGESHLATGSIEIHLRSSDWERHGHHFDSAYDDVILHAVLEIDTISTRTSSNREIPRIVLSPTTAELTANETGEFDWSLVGGEICAETQTRSCPQIVKQALFHLGDERLSAKTARMEARFSEKSPAQVLYEEIFDGLGFMANRTQMRALAEQVPLSAIEQILATASSETRMSTSLAILLGVAGFLPLSPSHSEMLELTPDRVTSIERIWADRGSPWSDSTFPGTTWKLARVRPTNHPVRRIQAGAALIASTTGGLSHNLLEPIRSGANVVEALVLLTSLESSPLLGKGRSIGLATNALLPVAFAVGRTTGDSELIEGASAIWERLAGSESNVITRRALHQVAGATPLRKLGARGQQGLIQLDTMFCAPRRCYECPIAGIVRDSVPECDTRQEQ